MSDTLRARIAAALADEFEGQARKFDDASWDDIADVVLREIEPLLQPHRRTE